MAELSLIEALERSLRTRGDRIVRGPGDDAAVVRARPVAVSSLDTVVEDVHFRRATHSPADVGHAALASALSDLAAMGAEAGEAYVGLVCPESLSGEQAIALVEAAEALAERTGVTIAGGDVASGPALVVTIAVTGWTDDAEALVGRDGARAGDLLGVTGALGGSGPACGCSKDSRPISPRSSGRRWCIATAAPSRRARRSPRAGLPPAHRRGRRAPPHRRSLSLIHI